MLPTRPLTPADVTVWRRQRQWTQSELAKALGRSVAWVWSIENKAELEPIAELAIRGLEAAGIKNADWIATRGGGE